MGSAGRMSRFDHEAVAMPWMAGLSPCLRVPVAARDLAAIEAHVGGIVREVPDHPDAPGYLVSATVMADIDQTLPVWDLQGASIFHAEMQLWVHVESQRYRRRFAEAFPNFDIRLKDIDHVMNRHVARLKGFHDVRLVAISRGANRSSGAISEKWAIEYHGSERMQERHRQSKAQVQYADIADLAKMLDIVIGGGVMDQLNEVQYLFRPNGPVVSTGP
jgi:hypothetical protein